MYSRALVGYEKAWGPDHTSTLSMVNNLGEILHDWCYHAMKSSTRGGLLFDSTLLPESNNSSHMVKLIDLCIRFPLCRPTLLAYLCKIFGRNGWDDLSATASSYAVFRSLPSYNAYCDGCERDLNISTGRFICKSCKDLDLCSSCFKKYELDGLKDVLKSCQDHHFLELSEIGLENNPSQTQLLVEEWLQKLTSDLKVQERNAQEP
jgi:ZZ type zinc finger protein